jgi:hypothetical protein
LIRDIPRRGVVSRPVSWEEKLGVPLSGDPHAGPNRRATRPPKRVYFREKRPPANPAFQGENNALLAGACHTRQPLQQTVPPSVAETFLVAFDTLTAEDVCTVKKLYTV